MKNMPNSVCWNITTKCNDDCLFCYRDRHAKQLSFDEQKRIIDKIANAGIRKLTFAGGEPLLVKELPELVLYAKKRNLQVSLSTNGMIFHGELRKFFLEQLDWLTLPLDGACTQTQQQMSRHERHFDTVCEILSFAKTYQKKHCRIKINTVISGINQSTIQELTKLILQFPVERWKVFQFVPLREMAKKNKDLFMISDALFTQTIQTIQCLLGEQKELLSISDRANIEQAHFVIFPDGSIKIADNCQDVVLGNALSDEFYTIWHSGLYNQSLHFERTKHCVAQ